MEEPGRAAGARAAYRWRCQWAALVVVVAAAGVTMFGRKSRADQEKREREQALKREEEERENRLYWASRIKGAQDTNEEHELTRVLMEYRLDVQSKLLLDWLKDFDRRVATEMREHAQVYRIWLPVLGTLLLVHMLAT